MGSRSMSCDSNRICPLRCAYSGLAHCVWMQTHFFAMRLERFHETYDIKSANGKLSAMIRPKHLPKLGLAASPVKGEAVGIMVLPVAELLPLAVALAPPVVFWTIM